MYICAFRHLSGIHLKIKTIPYRKTKSPLQRGTFTEVHLAKTFFQDFHKCRAISLCKEKKELQITCTHSKCNFKRSSEFKSCTEAVRRLCSIAAGDDGKLNRVQYICSASSISFNYSIYHKVSNFCLKLHLKKGEKNHYL